MPTPVRQSVLTSQGVLRTGEAARIIGISVNTLRAWDRRYGGLSTRGDGHHRRFDRKLCEALSFALHEGLSGESAIQRAHALVAAKILDDPKPLVARMARLEIAIMLLHSAVWELSRRIDGSDHGSTQ